MKLKQEKRYIQNRIKDIEGSISLHQSAIEFDDLCEDALNYRKWAIKELMVDLEAFRCYLNFLSGVKEEERILSVE